LLGEAHPSTALSQARTQFFFAAQQVNSEHREVSIKRNNEKIVAVSGRGGASTMITFAECAEFAGLNSSELITGSVLSSKHGSLLSSYLLNLKRSPGAVRQMIVSDIRAAIDMGASSYAADLLLVLRMFLSKHPEARIAPRMLGGNASAYGKWAVTPYENIKRGC
jgi:hypothetical protein